MVFAGDPLEHQHFADVSAQVTVGIPVPESARELRGDLQDTERMRTLVAEGHCSGNHSAPGSHQLDHLGR